MNTSTLTPHTARYTADSRRARAARETPIRLILAHPSRLLCETLRTALGDARTFHVAGCAGSAEQLRFLLPYGDVVLLGNALEDASALDVLSEMRVTHPGKKVLVLGVPEQPEQIVRYVEAGAAGYILENDSVEVLLEKLVAAHEGKAVVSPAVAAALMGRLATLATMRPAASGHDARQARLDKLTAREREVLALMAHNCSNREIAERLFIEHGTVKNHVHNVLRKLRVKSRHDAAALFQAHGARPLAVAYVAAGDAGPVNPAASHGGGWRFGVR